MKNSWHSILTQTCETLSTREELLRSCRELLAVIKQCPSNARADMARKMIVERAQQNIAQAARESGLEFDFGHLVKR